ncbi:ABC transporter permease subunit [candidate division KSB3 bacterium]|uniref:ABC transporter permease subunit n=1 Tax=candidate division KSB3 bacterium TaxID=2044937 RepID=A0A9D5Q551_9BACT|nr:ABC transporter permease subunit [candidate division KSB3 bacterium]MBD3324449.1 ABC transporter permease subunit [candidate division KSB3 bacterium]
MRVPHRQRFVDLLDRKAKYLFPTPALIVIFAIMLFPVIYTLYLSVHSWFVSSLAPPQFNGLENFKKMFFEDERFRDAVTHTLQFTILAIFAQIVLGVAIALVFNREFKGKGIVRTLFLLPMVATPVAISLVWMFMFNPSMGVLNYILDLFGIPEQLWTTDPSSVIPSLVLVDTWEWTPLITLIVLAGLASLPEEPYESAIIDGASKFQLFYYITLPLLRPTIITAALIRSIDCLKTFDIIMVITQGGPGFASETLNIYIFNTGLYYFRMGYASSMLVIMFAFVLGISLILVKVRRGAAAA